VGLRNALRLRRDQVAIADGITAGIYAGGATDPSNIPFGTPWSTSQLDRWVYQDIFGGLPTNTREAAMAIPAFKRSRDLVVVSGGKLPLVELENGVRVPDQPNWITQTGDGSSPQHRMAWTIDDLIWYGLGLWWRNNPGKPDETRQRVNQADWEINSDRREILVNGDSAGPDEVILFTGFNEGVLATGRQAIADVQDVYAIVRQRLKNPVPNIELHQTGGPALTKTEKDQLLADWRAARNDPTTGGVAYTSQYIEVKEHGAGNDSQLMIEGRNAAAVDAARMIGVHAGTVDATTPKASLNYETQTGRNEEFVDFDLDLYLVPIAARLSMDDVCAPGRTVAFDRGDFTAPAPSPTGPALED
jgi:hypothetical protein